MPIHYTETTQEFHLYNKELSYIFHVLPNGHLGNLHFGKRLSEKASYLRLREYGYRPLTSFVYEDEPSFSLQHTRQEYACYGTTDFSLPAFEIEQADGSCLSHFVYQGHRIFPGKPALAGLPHLYVTEEAAAQTLEIILMDDNANTQLTLSYTIFNDRPVLSRHARFEQLGGRAVKLQRALSMSLDLPDWDYEWLHLDGAWGRERHLKLSPLHQGCQSIYSLKGASSSEHNPFMALKRPTADEHQGEVLGFSLIYSGNFLGQVDVSSFGQTRVSLGIHPDRFTWLLEKGESFQTPEVVLVYSDQGLNGMSQAFHDVFREHLMRGFWGQRERPVLLNNWEAMSFDFDEERILTLARKAASVGVELFVMDDGWFGDRNHEQAGLEIGLSIWTSFQVV